MTAGAGSVAALARQLARREVSAVELAERALAALAGTVADHSGLEALLARRARDAARAADARRAAGEARSPLDGIPYAVKDAFAALGAPTTWGSDRWAGRQLATDAALVGRLDTAGAVLCAKLAMVELAGFGAVRGSGSGRQGPARNPWDPGRYAGGSSGGSAIAVATGAVPFSLGTETGGSVVGPAALCGVTGYRPTPGLLSREGMLVLSPTLDKPGVLARSAADCALVAGVMTGRVAHEGRSPQLVAPLRIGVVADEPHDWPPAALDVLTAARAAMLALGHPVSIDRAEIVDGAGALHTIMLAEAAAALREELADPEFTTADPRQVATLRRARSITAEQYRAALAERDVAETSARRLLARCDVLVVATRSQPAASLSAASAVPGDSVRPAGAETSVADRVRALANLIGLPGVTVPAGLSRHGLPVALHVVAPAGHDDRALAVARRFQERTDHHLLMPPSAVCATGGVR